MNIYLLRVTTLLLWVNSLALFAQQTDIDSLTVQTTNLEEVVISDSRFPLKRSQSGKPIVKINADEISKFQGLGLSELVRQYAGIEIIGSQSYAGQNKTISLRGGRNRQVLILIDGVRVSDPSRIDNDFNLNFLSLDQIESIEIMKGASSALYGSSAATGVIQIQTKKAETGFRASLQSSFGSDQDQDQDSSFDLNLFKNSLDLSYGGGKISAKAYAFSHETNGMSAVIGPELDPFSHYNIGASIQFKPNTQFDIRSGYDRSSINSDYDNSFPLEDANFKLITSMDRFHISPNYNYTNGGASLKFGYQKIARDFQSAYPFQTQGENTQIELNNRYVFGSKFYSVVGTLYQKQKADYEGGQELSQTDFFGNVVAVVSDRFRVNIGGRLNSHSSYGNQFTYSINPSFQLVQNDKQSLKFLGALSSAFIAPSLYQLFDPYSGNEDLEPEENTSFETGLEYVISDWNMSATYFYRNENPSLIYDLSTYRYENAQEEATYSGMEIQFSGSLADKLRLNQQTTFTSTKDGDLRYLPKFSSQTALTYSFNTNRQLSLRFQAVGERFGLDNTTLLKGYELFHLSFKNDLKNIPLTFSIHATNIFNANYVEIEQYSTRGRNFIVALTYRFP
jgi:vitamin B12 transporter